MGIDNTPHLRQLQILDPSKIPPIAIVGLGSLGSYIALGLVKMGATEIVGFDHDKVEIQNTGNQLYSPLDEDRPKAEALKDRLEPFLLDHQNLSFYARRWEGEAAPVIISAVDNLETRKAIYNVTSKNNLWLVDPRSGGMVWKVYAVKGESENYIKNEFDPVTTERRCGADGIVYLSIRVAQAVLLAIKKIVNEEEVPYLTQGIEK